MSLKSLIPLSLSLSLVTHSKEAPCACSDGRSYHELYKGLHFGDFYKCQPRAQLASVIAGSLCMHVCVRVCVHKHLNRTLCGLSLAPTYVPPH